MRVLLGVGGSELSSQALAKTVERAEEVGDDLTVAVFENEEVDRTQDDIEREVTAELNGADLEPTVRHIEDDPGGALVELAEREGFDRIVLGSGKRSTLGKIQLGSIAEFVLLNAQTPVTLIR
jgi:nucleotide-binding universal stress UspA family protein